MRAALCGSFSIVTVHVVVSLVLRGAWEEEEVRVADPPEE